MTEQITELCLSLTREQREWLIGILTLANKNDKQKNEDERFQTLLDVAKGMLGEEILSKAKSRELVIARRFIAYQMRKEGYSYSAIGRYLGKSHASVIHMCNMMDDVMRFQFQPEMRLWNQYQTKLKTYKDGTQGKDREL